MSDRRGFALLAVLWLVAMLGVLAATGLASGRLGAATTRNRVLLARASWAREACVALLQARYASATGSLAPSTVHADLASVSLGRGTSCDATLEDPSARINLNRADSATLTRLLRSSARSMALQEWMRRHGPLADVAQLLEVPGFDSAVIAEVTPAATTRGTGAINVNAATPRVLAAIGALPPEALARLRNAAPRGRPIASLDELLAQVSRPTRELLLQDYATWQARLRFSPVELLARVTGRVEGSPITSSAVLTVLPLPDRLAILRRESE